MSNRQQTPCEVLQALKDTDPWEAEDIDEILNAADASGDGELQIEDTMHAPCGCAWQLFWRTGAKCSCRIKTTRTAHMPGEGKVWAVWKNKGSSCLVNLGIEGSKKAFVQEAEMKCEAEVAEVPETEEEDAEEPSAPGSARAAVHDASDAANLFSPAI
eukprot:Skav228830  [mRNA]  locus=scaffold4977:5343:7422:- [translate_table: standard]